MLLGWCVEWGGVLMAGIKKRKGCVSCASSSLVIRLVSEISPFYYQIPNGILFCIRAF